MKSIVLSSLALAAMVSTAAAQDATKPAKLQGKPVQAAAPIVKSQEKVEVGLPVEGLTADNAEKVKSMLGKLKAELHVCEGCKGTFARAGECPGCKTALTKAEEPIIDQVATAPDKGEITLQTHPGMELRLSQIERALGASSITIDDKKMAISGHAILAIQAPADEAAVQTLQAAFQTAGLFERVNASPSQDGKSLNVEVVAGAKAPTKADITKTLQRIDANSKLKDVTWNSWAAHGQEHGQKGHGKPERGAKKSGEEKRDK